MRKHHPEVFISVPRQLYGNIKWCMTFPLPSGWRRKAPVTVVPLNSTYVQRIDYVNGLWV